MPQRQVTPFGPPAHFYECPRWHGGRWWASDMRGGTVYSYSTDGDAQMELQLEEGRPGGLGWGADGALLVVSMDKHQLLRRAPGGQAFEVFADLAPLVGDVVGFLNDMWVGKDGHAYVGFDADHRKYGPDAVLGMVIHVDPQARAEVAARGLAMPNGIVATPDGSTLVVAETFKPQFSGFAIGADGLLGPAFLWASLDPKLDRRPAGQPPLGDAPVTLDGCWMDAESHIWAADCRTACLRVAPGGAIVDSVFLPEGLRAWACTLGGDDLKTLMLCGADDDWASRHTRKASRLFTTRVDVPGA